MSINIPSLRFLNSLGLSQNERMVFDALLQLKMARNVSVIARTAKVPRTTTLYILKKFEIRKLVKRAINGKRDLWMYNRLNNK